MAGLNTLRTKGGAVVAIVIGIALLAFIVGEINFSSCRDQSIGTINGEKVSYDEYAIAVDRYTTVSQAMSSGMGYNLDHYSMANNIAWESLKTKYAYEPGLENLGIWTQEAEQIDMVQGEYLSQTITGNFYNPETGGYDPALLKDFLLRVEADQTGQMSALWGYLKEQMMMERSMAKYSALVEAGVFANNLDVEREVEFRERDYDVIIAHKEYSRIADSIVDVTKKEITNYYEKHKANYIQEPYRQIEYVIFDLNPSEEDYAEAEKTISSIAEEFAKSDEPMQYASLNSHSRLNTQYLSEKQIDPEIATVVLGRPKAMYGPVLKNNEYTLAREGETKIIPDSIGARHILLEPGSEKLADTILNELKMGGNFAEIARKYSMDTNSNSFGGDMGVMPTDMVIRDMKEFADALMEAKIGETKIIKARYGIHIAQLTQRINPTRKTQIATIKYTVEPSNLTGNTIYAQAVEFSSKVNIQGFTQAAKEEAVESRTSMIRDSDKSVDELIDAKELIRWAYNGKPGDVSSIMTIDGDYAVATLTKVSDDKYTPLNEVYHAIKNSLIKDKKADILKAEFAGATSIESALAVENSVETSIKGVNSETRNLSGIGIERALIGAISSTKQPWKLSNPIAGNRGVFLFEAEDIKESENKMSGEDMRIKLENDASSALSRNTRDILEKYMDTKDRRNKYF